MQLNLFVNSAYDLKNVNWRYGDLQPYTVAWIDSSAKRSTKIDLTNGVNPVWNEMFTIPLPSTSHVETAILYTDIVHAKSAANTKPLIGSARLSIRAALNEARSKGKASFSLILERPSGRPQGNLEIQIKIKDVNIIQRELYGQQARCMFAQPQPQPQPQPRPRPRPQPQPQQVNQYPNVAAPMRLGYPNNSPQNNIRSTLLQQPGNVMIMPNMRPQCRPVVNQQPSIGAVLGTLAVGVIPNQIGRMLGSFQRMNVGAFPGAQQANMAAMVNNTGMLGNNTNSTYGNDPAAAQGYDTTTGYDDGSYTAGTSADDGTNISTYSNDPAAAQFGTDGGLDLGGFDASVLDLGGD